MRSLLPVLSSVLVPALLTAACAGGPGRTADAPPPAAAAAPSSPPLVEAPLRPAAHHEGLGVDLRAFSTTDPASPWVVVNKAHPLRPLDYVPHLAIVRGYQVARVAAPALERLLAASDRVHLGLKLESAYRSYAYQVGVHSALVSSEGSAAADRLSARPGYSEHQTGLAVDVITPGSPGCDFEQCFGTTRAGRWLARDAWRFGFVVRYTAADRRITGYAPEPWHLRYVGRPLSSGMHRTGVATLEQVFGIRGGARYR